MNFSSGITFLCIILLLLFHDAQGKIVRVRLESCPGCKLNRLADVKAFVYEDLPKYDNTEFKKIHGASPVLFFINEADEVVEQHSIENLSRQECNDLLLDKGFKLKPNNEL